MPSVNVLYQPEVNRFPATRSPTGTYVFLFFLIHLRKIAEGMGYTVSV